MLCSFARRIGKAFFIAVESALLKTTDGDRILS